MKILLAHNHYRSSAPSGENAVFRGERALLRTAGVEIVSYERYNDDIDDASFAELCRIALSGAWSKQTYDEVVRIIRDTRPDLAHFHNTFPLISPSAYGACQDNGVPVVQTLHNYRLICPGGSLARGGGPCEDCVGTSLLPALRHRCYRGSFAATGSVVWMLARNRARGTYRRLVDRYIALTRFAAERLIAGGLPAERVTVIPNFFTGVLPPSGPRRGHAIYAGRLSEEKGVLTLAQAWRHTDGLALKIIGDGPLRAQVAEEIEGHALNAEMLGFLDHREVLSLIQQAALLVIPSECYENFPNAVLEAFACATPVVAANIGSLREIVEDGHTGLLFQSGNAGDLAEKVSLLIKSSEIRRFGERARAEFEERYTAKRHLHLLCEIYQQVIESRSPT